VEELASKHDFSFTMFKELLLQLQKSTLLFYVLLFGEMNPVSHYNMLDRDYLSSSVSLKWLLPLLKIEWTRTGALQSTSIQGLTTVRDGRCLMQKKSQ
jgi:hypothetical protein